MTSQKHTAANISGYLQQLLTISISSCLAATLSPAVQTSGGKAAGIPKRLLKEKFIYMWKKSVCDLRPHVKSGPNLNIKDHIAYDLCCSLMKKSKSDLSHIRAVYSVNID